MPAIGAYGYLKNLVTLAGAGLVVTGGGDHPPDGARLLAARPRGDLVEGADRAAGADLPDDPRHRRRRAGRGRWLDSKTFVFNESVVANEEGMRQIEFVLNGLGIELVRTHSPGWVDSIGDGNIGTTHADMFLMVPDHRRRRARAAPRRLRIRPLSEAARHSGDRGPGGGVLGPRGQRRHPRARQDRRQHRLADPP